MSCDSPPYLLCGLGKVPSSVITSDPTLRHSVPENYLGQFLLLVPLPSAIQPSHLCGRNIGAQEHLEAGTLKVHRSRVGSLY